MKLTGLLAEEGLHALSDKPHYHAGHKVPRVWIIVADRERAYIYCKNSFSHLVLIAQANAASPHHMHHERKSSDFHEAEENMDELLFMNSLAQWLGQAEQEGVFDRLAIIAAPRTLGHLRKCLSKKVHDRVMAEIDRDLAALPDHQIRERLADIVWF